MRYVLLLATWLALIHAGWAVVVPVSLTVSPNPATVGQTVTLNATLLQPDPQFGVEFYDGGTLLGTAPVVGATATLQVNTFTAGQHPLSATSLADGRQSAVVNLQVNPAAPPPGAGPTPDLTSAPRILRVVVEGLYPTTGSAPAGANVTYGVSIFNTGNTNDSYDLTLTSSVFTDSISTNRVELVSGTSQVVHVTVGIPSFLNPGTGGSTILTASSRTDPEVRASTVLTTAVEAASGPFVPRQSVTLRPGWNAVGLNATRLQEVLENPEVVSVAALDANGQYTLSRPDLVAFTPTARGYWVQASAATSLVYSGPLAAENRTSVTPGWNLLAFPGGAARLRAYAGANEVELETLIYPELLEIQSDHSYQPVSRPVAGRAYWVYAWQAGELRWP